MPVQKNTEPAPSFPDEGLACYAISDDALGEPHSLDDQFGNHPDLAVAAPGALCLPTNVPEPAVLLSLGPGLMLLAWLDRRRKRRS